MLLRVGLLRIKVSRGPYSLTTILSTPLPLQLTPLASLALREPLQPQKQSIVKHLFVRKLHLTNLSLFRPIPMASQSSLPQVPVKHADFISYVDSNPEKPIRELLEPFKQYDARIREVFAQEPTNPILADQHLNITPVFNGQEPKIKVRARDLESESEEEKDKYVMPLKEDERRPNGSPAMVQDIKDFQQNFAVFCESSLVDLDWSNVIAAGSSVATCLLPVPPNHNKSKRALRKDGTIYIMGGLVAGSTVKGDLWLTEVGNGSMACFPISTTGDGPGPRVGHASLLVGNAFIIFGGDTKLDDNDDLDDTLYLLNTCKSPSTWTRVATNHS